jgi:vancomycin permeability regulator SanA
VRTRSRIRPRYRWIVACLVLIPALVAAPWGYLKIATWGHIIEPGHTPNHTHAALVLGAKVGDDGEPSRFLRERIELGARLYLDGVVDIVVMSGATHADDYDEPATMREVALAMGVPADAIILDRAGIDTYASCENAAGPLALGEVIVVTQEFHVARATWLCRQAGLDAQGIYPPVQGRAGTVTGNLRELGADWKAVANVWGGRDGG